MMMKMGEMQKPHMGGGLPGMFGSANLWPVAADVRRLTLKTGFRAVSQKV